MSNSADALAWAIRVSKGLPVPGRMLLIVGLSLRVNNSDDSFIVFPSIRQLEDDCDMSRSSIKRWLKELEDRKLVEVFPATRENGSSTANRYRLPVHTIHFGPGGQQVEVDMRGGSTVDRGGRSNVDPGGVQAGPGEGSTGGPRMNSEDRTESIELSIDAHTPEVDLLGDPILTPEQQEAERKADTVKAIEEGWNRLAAHIPKVAGLRGHRMDDTRADTAVQRAAKFAAEGETPKDVWATVFHEILSSRFLCGETPPRDGRQPFTLQLTWLLEHRNFTKVVEGKYRDGRNPDLRGGGDNQPRYSPGGATVDRVLARRRADRERSAPGGNSGGAGR